MYSKKLSENSDSDSSLEPITEVFPPRSQDISPGDIVWAKFKYLYWPALVRAYYPKEKKISIWYCDDPGKTFKLPLKNIYLFHDSEMYKKILKDVKDAGVLKEHEGLKAHASTYLRRKLEGYQDDPRKFFDQTYPFFLVEEMLKKDPNADVSDIKIRPMYIDHGRKLTIRKRLSVCNNESDDSELESSDSDSETKTNTSDFISNVNVQLHEISSESSKEIDVDKIIKYILSGKADDYLQKVKLKKIPSEYRDLYEKSLKKKSTSEFSFAGPINNDSKLRKLIFYLLPLYEKMDNPLRKKNVSFGKRKALALPNSFKEKNTQAQYVASVFLPESIIFAISKVKKISLAEAKKLFVGKSESRTKVIESILAHADQYIQTKEKTECPLENVVRSKEHGVSKQKRVKKVCIDNSHTICDEILTTDSKSRTNLVKISDEKKSNETSSSKSEYEEFVGKSESRKKATESIFAHADQSIQKKEKTEFPVENVQSKERGTSKQKRSKKDVHPLKKMRIVGSDTVGFKILTTDSKFHTKFVKIRDAEKSNETSSSKDKFEELIGKLECTKKATESIFAHADQSIQKKEKTECPIENVVQCKKHGISKQKRIKKDVQPLKKMCIVGSDTIGFKILTTDSKSHIKHVKVSDDEKSNVTTASKNENEEFVGESESRIKAAEGIFAHLDQYKQTKEKTNCPVKNVQSKKHGTSKQKRSKKDVHPSKKECLDKLDTIYIDATSSSKNEYEEFVGKSESRIMATESILPHLDQCKQTKQKTDCPVKNVQSKKHGISKQKRSKKAMHPVKKENIDLYIEIDEEEILNTDLKFPKCVKIDDAVKSNKTSSPNNECKEFVEKSESRIKAAESILPLLDQCKQTKEKTDCPVKNVVQSKKHGTSKQKRSKKDVHPSKKECIDKLDTTYIEIDDEEILNINLKSPKCVKIDDAMKSNETSSPNNEYEERILSCIISGKANDYLKKIKLKSTPSKYLDLYEDLVKDGTEKLCNITYTGPMKDNNKLKELILYLLHLYDDGKESHRTKRSAARKCKSAMTAYYNDKKNPAVQYVIYVWLPEAIIFAISEIENVCVPEAGKLFDKYGEAKLVASLLKSLD